MVFSVGNLNCGIKDYVTGQCIIICLGDLANKRLRMYRRSLLLIETQRYWPIHVCTACRIQRDAVVHWSTEH